MKRASEVLKLFPEFAREPETIAMKCELLPSFWLNVNEFTCLYVPTLLNPSSDN